MTDVTTPRHSHDHAQTAANSTPSHAYERGRAAARASLLETSAAQRLAVVCILCAVLWAGVYWALH